MLACTRAHVRQLARPPGRKTCASVFLRDAGLQAHPSLRLGARRVRAQVSQDLRGFQKAHPSVKVVTSLSSSRREISAPATVAASTLWA